MIDIVYQLLKTIVNKELRGLITPSEFNLIAKQAQDRIFRGYFEDVNRDKMKENRGLTSKNFANLSLFQRQRIEQFSAQAILTIQMVSVPNNYLLPSNLYFIKDRGISFNGAVVDETQASDISFLNNSLATPSATFPTYEQIQGSINVSPSTVQGNLECRYLRLPLDPKWTFIVVSNVEMFDNSAADFQDFELHDSEFTNIVIIMLSYFGINIREAEVTQYAEALRQKQDIKEEQ